MNNDPSPLATTPADVAIIGTGYVGLTTAACLAHLGRRVLAVDIDAAKIAALRNGRIPILETGLDGLVAEGLDSGRLDFTTDYRQIATTPIVMLCLPTPHQPDGGLDLSYINAAATTIRPLLAPGATVVTKSTVPVGTHQQLTNWLDRPDLNIAANPEFLREGTAVHDFLSPDRIVIGAHTSQISQTVASLYEGIDAPIQTTDPTSAELIKYAANTFLATKLSFINEISRLCDHLGADIEAITTGLGSDHRIGPAFLRPGPGWGGSCFPKDTRGLTHLARNASQQLPVAEAAHASNQIHLDHVTTTITNLSPRPINETRIAVWGTTFKAGTNDTRDSPALDICERLTRRGATIAAYDPAASNDTALAQTVDDPYSACRNADLLVVLTEWPAFAEADLYKVAHLLAAPIVYDTRSIIDHNNANDAGLQLHQIGRPTLTQ